MFSELEARITQLLSHLCTGAKIFIIAEFLYNRTRVFALKIWLSQSLSKRKMVNLTKATNLHKITDKGYCRVCHIGSSHNCLWKNPCTTYIFKIMSIKFLSQKWLCYTRDRNTSKIQYPFTEYHDGQSIMGSTFLALSIL